MTLPHSIVLAVGSLLSGAHSSDELPQSGHERAGPVASDWSTFWWNDYDADGLVDAFVLQPGGQGRLLRNRGQGNFDDVTAASGMSGTSGVHMALWKDFDGDGRSDIFLASYRGASRLMRQARAGVFVDVTELAGLSARLDPIDAEWIDYDSDGWFDLRVTTLERDWIFQNRGEGLFGVVDLGIDTAVSLAELGVEMPATVDEARRLRGLGAITPGTTGDRDETTSTPGRDGFSIGPGDSAAEGGNGCALTVEDQSIPGTCLPASSIPTLGSLFPISTEFFIDAGNGRVGVGTTNPGAKLHVVGGDIRTSGKLISTATSGAPLAVSSSALVPNLNADKVDGMDASAFSQLGNSIETAEIAAGAVTNAKLAANAVNSAKIADGSITNADVSPSAAVAGTKIVPNFGSQDLITTGSAGFGASSPYDKVYVLGRLKAVNPSLGNTAVVGMATSTDPDYPSHGAYFSSASGEGVGAYCEATSSSNGWGIGVFGQSWSAHGRGAQGVARHLSAQNVGVEGVSASWSGIGVRGLNTSGSVGSTSAGGVLGETTNPNGYGVWGIAYEGTGWNVGIGGETSSPGGYAVYSAGNFAASGTKSFLQPHPTDPSKEIRFVCLEGNESGTYFRGSSELTGGVAVIEVPEEFRLASEAEDLTVQVTAMGPSPYLYVESKSLDEIVVRGGADVRFDYFVNGVRRGYADFEPIGENHAYVPRWRGEPFGTQYPDGIRRILISNGTLNPDGTPNESMAAELGWQLADRPDFDRTIPGAGAALGATGLKIGK